MVITQWDIDMLKNVLEYWNALSANPKDESSMSDHCHIENDSVYDLIQRLEKAQKGK